MVLIRLRRSLARSVKCDCAGDESKWATYSFRSHDYTCVIRQRHVGRGVFLNCIECDGFQALLPNLVRPWCKSFPLEVSAGGLRISVRLLRTRHRLVSKAELEVKRESRWLLTCGVFGSKLEEICENELHLIAKMRRLPHVVWVSDELSVADRIVVGVVLGTNLRQRLEFGGALFQYL